MSENEKKKIGVTLPYSLHLEVKSEAPRHGMNIESAYEEALNLWLMKVRGKSAEDGRLTGQQSRAVTEFLDFINHGDQSIVDIVRNLIATHTLAKKKKVQGQGRKAG